MKFTNVLLALAAATMLMTGCAKQRGPANEALDKIEASLKDAVTAGKAHAKAALAAAKTEWEGLSAEVSKQVDSIQTRIDELSKQKRLPWGINKDEFEGSKSAFESMKAQWNDATAEFKKGDAIEANSKAKTAKGMGDQLFDQLKIKQT